MPQDNIIVAAQTVVAEAKRLGLLWSVRYATVVSGGDPGNVHVIYDGDPEDTVVEFLVSVVGKFHYGQRVVVFAVPPAGNFVVGTLNSPKYADAGAQVGFVSSIANSAAIGTTPTAVLTQFTNMQLYDGVAYRVICDGNHFSSGAGILDQLSFWTDAVSTGGTVFLGNHRTEGGASTHYHAQQIFRKVGTRLVDTWYLASNSTSGTVTQFAGITTARYVEVQVAGRAEDYPDTPTII